MFACLKVKRHEDNQTFFTKNGGALLEELTAFSNGRSNPTHHFSAKELLRATTNYDTSQIFVEGLANVLAYLHAAFSRPVIHRDIKSSNIILDQNNAPKLIDFRLCISIPEGQSPLEGDVIRRTEWLTPPENWSTSYLTEKADVYQFGMLLIEF
ncbi:PREDICTED: non-functional pseudokinase ZED1 [Theobroma cacao]|uniref:Non-functional pseudokinase ZED1 n=1 Tax=Theobroma cacao TaxID=3641 RepID=A0AB32WFG7_THECC|nr:PREDICTED: non-functional pseudokinase ZED1 [Theobroma cacao]